MRGLVRLATALFVSIWLLPAAPAVADEGERINMYEVEVIISDRGLLDITETITYNFGTNLKHGTFRHIPIRDYLENGFYQPYDIKVTEVLMDLMPVPYETSIVDGEFLSILIGDADVFVTGRHEYRIRYQVENGLGVVSRKQQAGKLLFSEGDAVFYWDVLGTDWEVPIMAALVVIVPPSPPKLADCWYGPPGSGEECANYEDKATSFTLPGRTRLNPGEGMTVDLIIDSGAFVTPIDPYIETPWRQRAAAALPYGVAGSLAAAAGLGWLVWRRRRDTKTVPVLDFIRYEPPAGLGPAEMAVSWRGKLDARGFTAALLELAARGIVRLQLDESERLVVAAADLSRPMAGWERRLLTAVLAGEPEAVLAGYRKAVGDAVAAAGSELKSVAVAAGRFNPKAWRSRQLFLGLAIGFVLLGLVGLTLVEYPQAFVVLLPTAFAAGIASTIGIFLMPLVQTEQSAGFLSEVMGFKRLLDTDAAAARREFAHRSGLSAGAIFATMLPFAVVYELEDAWASAFPDITPAELAGYGLGFAGADHLGRAIHSTQHSLAAAMTSPSKSGSGGGGGSSGGGGGGGGGGSW